MGPESASSFSEPAKLPLLKGVKDKHMLTAVLTPSIGKQKTAILLQLTSGFMYDIVNRIVVYKGKVLI